jgi:hypothetical protein
LERINIMAKVFNTHVAVHKNHVEREWFAPGDKVPAWAEELVGPHVYAEHREEEDIRLTDPEQDDDDPETQWSTVNTLPPTGEEVAETEDVDLDSLKKDELKELAESRGLDTSGTKAELVERIAADMDEDEE